VRRALICLGGGSHEGASLKALGAVDAAAPDDCAVDVAVGSFSHNWPALDAAARAPRPRVSIHCDRFGLRDLMLGADVAASGGGARARGRRGGTPGRRGAREPADLAEVRAGMVPKVRIGNQWVGGDERRFVIAEAGANHNRSLSLAKELIDVATEAGADAVKFQTYSAETLYSKKTPRFSYLQGVSSKGTWDLIKEIELPREWQGGLAAYATKGGILLRS